MVFGRIDGLIKMSQICKICGFEETDNPDGICDDCRFCIIDNKDIPPNF